MFVEDLRRAGERLGLVALAVLVLTGTAAAQFQSNQYLGGVGVPAFTTALPVESGFINAANGNVHKEILLGSVPQRGSVPMTIRMVYDSRIWKWVTSGSSVSWQPTNVAGSQGGWRPVASADPGTVTYTFTGGNRCPTYSNFQWKEANGTLHPFTVGTNLAGFVCTEQSSDEGYSIVSEGLKMYVTNFTQARIVAKDGTQLYPQVKDTNGNFFTADANGNIVDTLGRTPVTKTVNGNQTYYDILNSQGGTSRFTVTTAAIPVNTAFGQGTITEYNGTITVVTSIGLPDGTSYTFDYDSGTAPGNYGLLRTMTLPTGGQVTYAHTTYPDSYNQRNRWVSSRTSGGSQWTYTPQVISSCPINQQGCQQKVTVTQPSGDQSVYTFSLNSGAWNSERKSYTGSATPANLLLTQQMTYDPEPLVPGIVEYLRLIRETTIVPVPIPGSSITRKTEYTYDSAPVGNLITTKDWNFYTGTPSATPARKTDIAYLTGSAYTSKDILNRPASVTVTDGAGGWLSQTKYTYDPTTLTNVTEVTHHDDAGFGAGYFTRGNVWTVQQYLSSAASCVLPNCLSTTMAYDTTGQVRQVTDPKGNVTSLSYNDNFYRDNGANPPLAYAPPAPTNAYLTQVTQPLIGPATFGYYFDTGKLAKSVDQNNADSYLHYLDSLDRQTHAYGPSVTGGRTWSLNQYTSATQLDTYATVSDATASPACTSCIHQQVSADSLGRVAQSKLVNDPQGATMVDTVYDTSGRVQSVSNPHRVSAEPTDGLETPQYDGLDRTTRITHADTNFAQVFYGAAVTGGGGASAQLCASATYGLGYPVLSVDEAGKKRQVWTDGLGRTIEVDEPDAGGILNLNTCYKYDLLDNLKEVNQGTQTRLYTYDALARVVTSDPAESSPATSFYYTTAGGALCSGNPSAACRRTDARAITTTYAYDALNRLISVTYSDSTPARNFSYDQPSYNGLTISNGKGRRTGMSDAAGLTAWSYDAAGRVLTERRTISGVTKNISYTYKLGGAVETVTYPNGRVITYTHSAIGRSLTAKDIANNINYVTDALYAAPGGLSSLKNGVTGTFAGITRTNGYNNRLQGTLLSAASPTQTVSSLGYVFGASNNSQIAAITNNLNNNRTQSFTYDTLRRLWTAQSQANSGPDCWGQSFTYDRWANKPTDTVTKCSAPPLGVSISSATNRIDPPGFAYDNAGDMTTENATTYTFNAEEQITVAAGVTYTYDGDGLRVKKSNGKLYWRSIGIDALAETDLAGNNPVEFIYFAGQRVAMRDAAGGVYYIFSDQVSSTRVVTNATGTVCRDMDFFPFGGEKITLNTCPALNYKFASYERDPETGLDYAISRYYNSRLGRFMSPDPLSGSAGNPQSLNLYAYVQNDPVNLVDPDGTIPRYFWWVLNQWSLWDSWGFQQMLQSGGGGGGSSFSFSFGLGGPDGVIIAQGPFGGPAIYRRPSLLDFLPDLCSGPSNAYLPSCGLSTINGIPVFSGFPQGWKPEWNAGALDSCKAKATTEYVRRYNSGKVTGLGEGALKIAKHTAVAGVIHIAGEKKIIPKKVGILAHLASWGSTLVDIAGWWKGEAKSIDDYDDWHSICEAAFGDK